MSHCDDYHRMGNPNKRDELPLQPIISYEPFDKRGMDFVGPIDPLSNQNIYILICIDYLTKWEEVKELKAKNEKAIVEFIKQKYVFNVWGTKRNSQ